MATQKDLSCPHCKRVLPFGQGGFLHDDDLNFICSHCLKPIFGVTEAAETEIKKVCLSSQNTAGFHSHWRKEPLPIRLESLPQQAVESESESGTGVGEDTTHEEYNCFT